MINSPQQLIYNKSAASRIFGIPRHSITRLEVWANCIFVVAKGYGCRFVSKSAFKSHFVGWRQQQSKSIQTRNLSASDWSAFNPEKDSYYRVSLSIHGVFCECEDLKNQLDLLGAGCCKHGYAVLSQIGFRSLSEYLESVSDRVVV